jgi:beta-alanine degradation protein BauB
VAHALVPLAVIFRKDEGVVMNIKSALILFAAVGVSCIALAAPSGQPSVSTPVTDLKYGATGISDGVHGELYAAAAYGDLTHGPHGTFIKMPAGYVSPPHTHSEDYWSVVVSGVMANGPPGSKDIPLPAGSYYFQKGGETHVTKCLTGSECVFFVNQTGKFDYMKAEK